MIFYVEDELRSCFSCSAWFNNRCTLLCRSGGESCWMWSGWAFFPSGGDAGSLTPRCSATHCGIWRNTCHEYRFRTTTVTTTTTTNHNNPRSKHTRFLGVRYVAVVVASSFGTFMWSQVRGEHVSAARRHRGATTQTVASARTCERRHGPGRE